MIDGKGRVRITNFGLTGFAEQISRKEVLAGTPAYRSPEKFAGQEVTARSDIYALYIGGAFLVATRRRVKVKNTHSTYSVFTS